MEPKKMIPEVHWPDRVSVNENAERYEQLQLKMSQKDYQNEILNNPKIEIEMKNQIEKTESGKKPRFTIIENGIEVLNTSKEPDSSGKIIQLQNELKPLIVLLDHKKRSSIHFKKESFQRNYRVKPGDYEKDTLTKTKIEDSEAE